MGNKLNVNQPCAVAVKGAQLHPVLAGVHLMEVSLRVCWTLGRPCLQCGVLFQAFSTRKIIGILDQNQSRATEMVKDWSIWCLARG